jgi:hypothetical protein
LRLFHHRRVGATRQGALVGGKLVATTSVLLVVGSWGWGSIRQIIPGTIPATARSQQEAQPAPRLLEAFEDQSIFRSRERWERPAKIHCDKEDAVSSAQSMNSRHAEEDTRTQSPRREDRSSWLRAAGSAALPPRRGSADGASLVTALESLGRCVRPVKSGADHAKQAGATRLEVPH